MVVLVAISGCPLARCNRRLRFAEAESLVSLTHLRVRAVNANKWASVQSRTAQETTCFRTCRRRTMSVRPGCNLLQVYAAGAAWRFTLSYSEDRADSRSMTAVVLTLLGVVAVAMILYFAVWAPSRGGSDTVIVTPGPAGPAGTDGEQGAPGSQGAQGNQGMLGNQGNQGNQGTQGNQGNQGTTGTTGETGVTGGG